MSVSKSFLLTALLKENFFPFQKKKKDTLPPVFNSKGLTKEVSQHIRDIVLSKKRMTSGFDSIQYKSTRFNNVPRLLSIPHPKPYVDLCFEMFEHWAKIKHICSNPNSLISPKKHSDGRIIIMDYETSSEKRNRYYEAAFGKKFLAHADISNCFPSLYSHAIPWALVGFDEAKSKRGKNEWFNRIDMYTRACNRNETSGVPVGPATSNIACEIILRQVDEKLRKKFNYVRYIDDYTAYCKTHKEAEDFIRELSMSLMQYRLQLNIKKTEVKKSPQAINEEWVGRMREIIPNSKVISASKVSDILDAAVRLLQDNPDGSILKYAATSILKKLDDSSAKEFSNYIIRLCFHYPVLISVLKSPFIRLYTDKKCNYKKQLDFLLKDSISYGRSDTVCWILYYLKLFHDEVSDKHALKIIEWGDSMALTLLTEFKAHQSKVIDFTKKLNKSYLYELDNYWMLLYQLYLKRKIKNVYDDNTFSILRRYNVSFVKI